MKEISGNGYVMVSMSDKSDMISWVSGIRTQKIFIPPKILMFIEMLLSIRTENYLIKVKYISSG